MSKKSKFILTYAFIYIIFVAIIYHLTGISIAILVPILALLFLLMYKMMTKKKKENYSNFQRDDQIYNQHNLMVDKISDNNVNTWFNFSRDEGDFLGQDLTTYDKENGYNTYRNGIDPRNIQNLPILGGYDSIYAHDRPQNRSNSEEGFSARIGESWSDENGFLKKNNVDRYVRKINEDTLMYVDDTTEPLGTDYVNSSPNTLTLSATSGTVVVGPPVKTKENQVDIDIYNHNFDIRNAHEHMGSDGDNQLCNRNKYRALQSQMSKDIRSKWNARKLQPYVEQEARESEKLDWWDDVDYLEHDL